MKLSNKARYGVRAVFDIAFHSDGGASQIKDISARQQIPARFLEQIFQQLKRAGLVNAKRGPKGGYRLARPAEEISLGAIVSAIEGPIALCGDSPAVGSQVVTQAALRELGEVVQERLDQVSVAALCERGDALGLRGNNQPYVYSI